MRTKNNKFQFLIWGWLILALVMLHVNPANASPSRDDGTQGSFGSLTDGAYLEYKVSGATVEKKRIGRTDRFEYTGKMTAKTVVLEGRYYMAPPVGCKDDDFYYHSMVGEIIVEREGQEEIRVKQMPLVWGGGPCGTMQTYDYKTKLEYDPRPGEIVTLHAMVNLCKENTKCNPIDVKIRIVIPKITETKPPTMTPEVTTLVKGKLTVPSRTGTDLPLRNATLSLFRGSNYLGQIFTGAWDGSFSFDAKQPGDYEIRAFLLQTEDQKKG